MRTKLLTLALLVLLLSSLLSPVRVHAAGTDLVQVGQIGGVTNAVVFSGDQLYFSVGPRIARMAVSASTPGAPTKPGVYGGILPGIPEDIKVANGYLYVAMGYAGVAVVDATTLAPVSIQLLPGAAFAAAVAVGSQRLYVAAGNTGIVAYDLGVDKKTLSYSQTKTFTSPVRNVTDVETLSVTVEGATQETLFVCANNFSAVPANRGGVLGFDITTSPALGVPSKSKEQIDVNALAVTASFVYAAGDDAFYVLDTPSLGGAGGVFSQLALTDAALEVSSGPSGNNTVYLISGAGIDVVDVSTPTAPVKKTTNSFTTEGSVIDLAAAEFGGNPNTFLYLADFNAGLSIASSPHDTPEALTLDSPSYELPRPSITSAVAGASRQAFAVSDSSDLWTISSANPAALTVVGSGIITTTSLDYLTTYQNLLLASAGTSGLLLYQINPGGEPTSLGSYMLSGIPYGVAVSWPNAVVADGTYGLVVVNISGTMGLTGFAPAPDFDSDFHAVDVQGNYAYVSDNNGKFRIYDLTDPTGPIAMGTLAQAGVLDVKVSGNFAFLACGTIGIRVVDITDPNAPAFVSGADYNTPGLAQSLAGYKNYLFVADGDDGVHMLAIQPSGQLTLVNTVDTSGSALQLALVPDDYLYVADGYGGLVVLRSSLFYTNRIILPLIARDYTPG